MFGFSRESGLDPVIMLAATDRVPTMPLSSILAPLGNYVGLTNTLALLPGSPAINTGSFAATTTDQQGVAAVGRRDIGAYESIGFALTVNGSPQSASVKTAFALPLTVRLTETAFNRPLPGASLMFVAPLRGASAVFNTMAATTDSSGHVGVTASANEMSGTYDVFVLSNGVTLTMLELTNQAAALSTSVPGRVPTQVERDLQGKPLQQQVVTTTVEKAILCVDRSAVPANLDAYQGVATCNQQQ